MQCMQGELATISCALIFKIGVNQQSHIQTPWLTRSLNQK